jgi:hypothetical protein
MKRLLLVVVVGCGGGHKPVADVEDHVEPATAGQEGDDTALVPETQVERDLLGQAMHVFQSMRSTAYTHTTTIDATAGKFEFDCSGFVGYVLAQSQPRALAELRGATKKRPLAKHFVAFFQNLPEASAWRPIQRAADLGPGDLIAWLKPADVVTKNTGHVMIVRARPRRDPKHPDIWVVPIIDSTAVPHGKSDSRKRTGATGLGTGEVLLVVDDAGAPVGYRWSRGSKATLHLTTITLAGVRVGPIERDVRIERDSVRSGM